MCLGLPETALEPDLVHLTLLRWEPRSCKLSILQERIVSCHSGIIPRIGRRAHASPRGVARTLVWLANPMAGGGQQKDTGINTNPVNTKTRHRSQTEKTEGHVSCLSTDANALQLHLLASGPPTRPPAPAPGFKTYKPLSIHKSAKTPSQDAFLPDIRSLRPQNPPVPGTQVSHLGHPSPANIFPCRGEDIIPTMAATFASLFISSPPLPRALGVIARAKN